MRSVRAISVIVVAAVAWLGGTAVAGPVAATSGPSAPTVAPATFSPGEDVALIGNAISSVAAGALKMLNAGPAVGTPTVQVDAASSTVTVAVDDPTIGKATLTMAWPAPQGTIWLTDYNASPEQTVRLTRGTGKCTFTGGRLTVHRAEATPTGEVAALSVDVTGTCPTYRGASSGAQIRIGDSEPTRAVSVPRAAPASFASGALTGSVVTHEATVTNSGPRAWKITQVGTSSSSSSSPRFQLVADADHCSGRTLASGETCTVQVAATATANTLWEYLLVIGDQPMTLVVPLTLEGFAPVEPPTDATAVQGRLSATASWQPPSTLPSEGYRVYDITGGARTLMATAPPSATSVIVPGHGPRRLSVVAATGRFAESTDSVVDVPAVTSELVADDWYGASVAVATDGAGASLRPLTLASVVLDPSRTRWVTIARADVSICPVATEQCVTVPGTSPTSSVDFPREAVWLPDGTIAFLRGQDEELRTLWVVRPDGSGLRKVAAVPHRARLAAAASGTEVVVLSYVDFGQLERVRLSDGRITAIPGTVWVDDFSVSTQGRLVVESRDDKSTHEGSRTTTIMNLDGSGARRLALPVGDNRDVTFDQAGTRVAFARYTGQSQATLWVAAADGSNAQQISTAANGWIDLSWSVGNLHSPTAGITVPAFTTRSASLAIGAVDADDAAGSLRRQCRLDSATAWTACGATMALSGLAAGTHTLRTQVTDASGRQSAVVTKSWVVDAAAPTATLNAPPVVQTRTPMTLSWTAADVGGSGLASYDVRARTAAPSARLGSYQYPASWQKRTTRSLPLTLSAGYQYCFSVRSRDRAGNVGPWTAERCTSMPLDDRGLAASTGWTRATSSSYLFSTYSRTVRSGAQLTRTSISGRRVALLATTCASCGSVDVYHAGVKLGRVNLYSSTTKVRQVKWLPLQPTTRSGTVTVRSTGTRQVVIDGLVVVH